MIIIDEKVLEGYADNGVEYFSKELSLPIEEIVKYGLEFETMGHYLAAVALFDYCINNMQDEHRKWEIQSYKDRSFMKYYKDSYYLRLHYSQEVEFDLLKAKQSV